MEYFKIADKGAFCSATAICLDEILAKLTVFIYLFIYLFIHSFIHPFNSGNIGAYDR